MSATTTPGDRRHDLDHLTEDDFGYLAERRPAEARTVLAQLSQRLRAHDHDLATARSWSRDLEDLLD